MKVSCTMGIANSGDTPVGRFFGLDPAAYYGTGAGAGSEGIGGALDTGTPLGGPIATAGNPFESSQGPRQMAQVLSSSTETPAAASEYARVERISGVHLNTGGEGADGEQFGMAPLATNQILFHPNSNGTGRRP